VRKAFGATSCVLFSQIIWENLILTVIGGCLGLIISYGMVLLSKNWLLTLLDDNVTALPDGVGVSITPQMLFSPVLFMCDDKFVLSRYSGISFSAKRYCVFH
jgi:putative ABC transport system permease protein